MRPLSRIVIALVLVVMVAPAVYAKSAASLTMSPTFGPPTTHVVLSGSGFDGSPITIRFDTSILTRVQSPKGAFTTMIVVPQSAPPGSHQISAMQGKTVAMATFVVRTDWPQFGFGPAHTGYNPYENVLSATNVPALALDWKAPIDSAPLGAPAVSKGSVYVSCGQTLYAFDAATGSQRWTASVPGGWFGQGLAAGDGLVFIGTYTNPDEPSTTHVSAFDAATGAVRWTSNVPERKVMYVPTVAHGMVYVIGLTNWLSGRLYAFDAMTGTTDWVVSLSSEIDDTPTVAHGMVYVGTSDGNLYALDSLTGAQRWVRQIGTPGPWSVRAPAVAKGVVYAATGAPNLLYALDAATGATLWSVPSVGIAATPAVAGGLVYVQAVSIQANDAETGALRWSAGPFYSTGFGLGQVAVANGVVYSISGDGTLRALDATNGLMLWAYAAAGAENRGSPVVANGVVYSGFADANLYAFHLPGHTP